MCVRRGEAFKMLIEEFYGGYRFFGHWNQIKVYSKEQVIELLSKYSDIDHCGISISTFVNDLPILLFVPFDFDAENIEDAYKEAVTLYEYFKSLNYTCMLNFSGSKGFHVLLKVKPDLYNKAQLRSFQCFIRRLYDFKTLDPHLFGDLRRLIRIPNTLNISSGKPCVTLDFYKGKEFILPSVETQLNGNSAAPIQIASKDFYKQLKVRDYPCVEYIVATEEEPPQLIRFAYVVLRLAAGYTPKQILEEIRGYGWIDFDERKTAYQINHIASREYYPPSCKTLMQLGFCLGKDCPYWRRYHDENNHL